MISFNFCGVKIRIKFMFVALVTIFLIIDRSGYSVLSLAVCALHEIGHIVMFFLVGYKPTSLTFELTGICIKKPSAQLSYAKEMLVQLAGSATDFVFFALLYNSQNEITATNFFAAAHLVLGIFHLLPLNSFDGGKLLEITLLRYCSILTTHRVCCIVDIAITLILFAVSVIAFIYDRSKFTLMLLAGGMLLRLVKK